MGKLSHLLTPTTLPECYKTEKFVKDNPKTIFKNMSSYNFLICGHVDAGKSSLVGTLLSKTGLVSQRVLQEYKTAAESMGKSSFWKAWLTDFHKEERETGKTLDLAHVECVTNNRHFTVIDAPGHKDYINNMITGASQADIVGIVIDAYAFHNSLKNNTDPFINNQILEHLKIGRAFGCERAVLILNKIDSIDKNNRLESLENVISSLVQRLSKVAYTAKNLEVVPVSAMSEWGITERRPVEELPTRKVGEDFKSLIQVMDTMKVYSGEEPKFEDMPVRLMIEDTLKDIPGTGVVVTGKLYSGIIKKDDELLLMPGNIRVKVKGLQMHRRDLEYALPRHNIGISIKGITHQLEKSDIIQKNMCLTSIAKVPKTVKKFKANIALIAYPSENGLVVGRSNIICHYGVDSIPVSIEKVENVVDLRTKQTFSDALVLMPNQKADVTFKLHDMNKEIIVEKMSDHPKLSKITLRDCELTCGWGNVIEIIDEQANAKL